METAFFPVAPQAPDELGAEGAALLTEPHVQRLLGPFFGPGRSVPEAARVLGLEPRALRYWVRKLVGSGVLIESGDASSGRRRVYRTAAPAYFVPFERVPRLTLEGLFERAEAVPLGLLHRNLLALAHGTIPGLHRWGLWLRPGRRMGRSTCRWDRARGRSAGFRPCCATGRARRR